MTRRSTRGRGLGAGRLWKRGAAWVLDYADEHGRRRREVLGTTKREAEALQAEIIARRNRIMLGLDAAAKDMPLNELRDRYLADLGARVTPRHALNVSQQLALILEAIPARTVRELTPADYLAYRASQKERGLSNRCCNVHLQAVRGMLTWALRLELIDKNPLAGIAKLPDRAKHQTKKRRALSEAEVERFLGATEDYDAAWGAGRQRVPQSPMWRMLVETGARYGEMRQLVWADLDEESATLHLRAEVTKAGRERWIPIRETLRAQLVGLRSLHWRITGHRPTAADPIFLSPMGRPLSASTNIVRRPFDQILKAARIEQEDAQGRTVDIHALRHTFVSRLQRAGVSLVHAQKLAGHSDPKLTAAIYTHLDQDDLRVAIEMLPSESSAPEAQQERRAV